MSIGLPVYNGERFLAQALDSLLAQDFTDFEIVIVDNASTDTTVDIIRKYQAADSRIRLFVNSHNLGAAPNHNLAFQHSTGPLFKFGSSDDEYAPTWLSRCVDVLDNEPDAVLAYTDTIDIDDVGNVIHRWTNQPEADDQRPHRRFAALVSRDHECFPVYGLVRRDVLQSTRLLGSYPDSDRVLLAEIALQGRMVKVHEPLFRHREHAGRSVRAHRTSRSRVEWFDTSRAGKIPLPAWRLGLEYVRAIGRSSISPGDRLGCCLAMCVWTIMNSGRMVRTLLRAIFEYARAVASRRARPNVAGRRQA